MADEGLKVSLILDPGNSAAAAKSVGDAIVEVASDADKASVSLNNLAKGVNSSQAAMKIFQTQAKSGQIAFAQYGQSAGKAVSALSDLRVAAPNTASALINVSRVAQDAPFGFIAIQNNIPPLIDSFQSLVKSTGSVTAALKAIGSGLVGFGGIGVAVSLATSALTLFSLASRKSKDDTEKLAEAQKTVKDVLRDTTASVQGEIATTQALSAIVLDSTRSYEARNAALNQLKKTGGDYYKSLSIEKSSYDDLKAASDRYTNSIIRAAAVKGLQDQISSLAGELAKSAPIINKGFASLVAKNPNDPFKSFADSVANGAKGIALNFRAADSLLAVGARKVSTDIGAAADNITRTTEDKFGKITDLQTRLKGFVDQLAATLSGTDTPDTPKTAKSVVTVTDVLADLDKQLLKTNALFVNSGDTLQRLTDDQIKNLQNALAGLIDIGILPGDKIFDQLKSRVDDLQKVAIGLDVPTIQIPVTVAPRFPTGPNAIFNPDLIKQYYGENGPQFKIPVTIDPIPKAKSNSIFGQDLLNMHFRPQVNKFTADLNDLIQKSIETGIGSISDALGNALVTGDIGGVLKAFINSIATFMQKLGVSLIATGVGIEAFKASLDSLNGIGAVVAGAALVLAAGAFKAIANGGASSFATGGTAYGPQLAIVGDNPQREEHILSNSQLDRIASNGGGGFQNGQIVTRVLGQDIALVYEKFQRSKNRIN